MLTPPRRHAATPPSGGPRRADGERRQCHWRETSGRRSSSAPMSAAIWSAQGCCVSDILRIASRDAPRLKPHANEPAHRQPAGRQPLISKLGKAQDLGPGELFDRAVGPSSIGPDEARGDVERVDRHARHSARPDHERKPRPGSQRLVDERVELGRAEDRPPKRRSADNALGFELHPEVAPRDGVDADDRGVDQVRDAGVGGGRRERRGPPDVDRPRARRGRDARRGGRRRRSPRAPPEARGRRRGPHAPTRRQRSAPAVGACSPARTWLRAAHAGPSSRPSLPVAPVIRIRIGSISRAPGRCRGPLPASR
jgi:hypothetical protein